VTIPDYATVHLCSVLATSAFGVMFLVLWYGRERSAHLLLCALSSLIYGAALIGLGLGLARIHPLMGALMFAGLGGSSALLMAAVNAFEGRKRLDRVVIALPLAPALAFAIPAMLPDGTFGVPALTAGRIANSLALAGIFITVATTLLRTRDSRAPRARRIVAFAHLGYVPGYFISIALEVFGALPIDSLALIPMLSDQLLLATLNLGLLWMPAERDSAALRDTALRDPLTGAGNRAALQAAEARGVAVGTALILIDVDHFKQVNDLNGHAAGDALLMGLATLATAALPPTGRLYRLGGDEFVATLPSADAQATAERILWEAQMRHDGPRCSISVGVAHVEKGDSDYAPALARADALMYRAKAEGRGRLAA